MNPLVLSTIIVLSFLIAYVSGFYSYNKLSPLCEKYNGIMRTSNSCTYQSTSGIKTYNYEQLSEYDFIQNNF